MKYNVYTRRMEICMYTYTYIYIYTHTRDATGDVNEKNEYHHVNIYLNSFLINLNNARNNLIFIIFLKCYFIKNNEKQCA